MFTLSLVRVNPKYVITNTSAAAAAAMITTTIMS